MNASLAVFSPFSRAACALKAWLYRRGWKKAVEVPGPVISVGNLAFGGSGKTPLVMEIIDWALSRGLKPALVTRGYKGLWERDGGVLSDGRTLRGGWREAGDEPVLVARRFPAAGVFVGRRRDRSCFRAREMGFDIIILDDGFQHLRLGRDLDIVLHGFGPGPLREGPRSLRRAGILLREAGTGEAEAIRRIKESGVPSVYEFRIRANDVLGPEGAFPPEDLRGKTAVAFCAIARPGRFFRFLEGLGLKVLENLVFPDHFDYPPWSIERVGEAVIRQWPDVVITTEKDAVKLEGAGRRLSPVPLLTLRIGLELPASFFNDLGRAAAGAAARKSHA
jgi:tetraacyldisaccharide 4'-kinase